MVKLLVSVSSFWVLKHHNDDVLPIDKVKDAVLAQLGNSLAAEDSGMTVVRFAVNDEKYPIDELIEKVKEICIEALEMEDGDSNLTVKIIYEAAEGDDKEATKDSSATERCLARIESLVGGEEFKKLAGELVDIAPQIVKNKTYDIFKYQAYVFSINDGYGLSTYLSVFAELLASLGIKDIGSIDRIIEERLPPPKGESTEPFDSLRSILSMGSSSSTRLLCIDISEWMNKTDSKVFKDSLLM